MSRRKEMNIKLVDSIVDEMNYKQVLAKERNLEVNDQKDY